ncbi:hypothetical protein Tco_0808273 [Tanacetum coccineum]
MVLLEVHWTQILLVKVAIEASACKPCASLMAFEDDSDEDEAFMPNAKMSNYVSLFGDGHIHLMVMVDAWSAYTFSVNYRVRMLLLSLSLIVIGMGIVPSIAKLFPNAEDRFCVKHIHDNMKQKWKGVAYKEMFEGQVKCVVMCEVFNGKLVGGRDKPIIATLEFARCDGPLTPTATKILKANLNEAKKRWELTGIPCKHVVAANWNMSLNNQQAGIPEEWVHPCYRSNQIRGRIYWPKFNVPTTLLPPEHHPQVSRPPKQRKKSVAEMEILKIIKNGKLSRKHKTVTCDKCKTKGHNSRSCTGLKVPMSNKRKVISKGMDLDTDAPTCSQSKKRATTEAASSATQTNKGKAPATNDGPQKKRASRKKLIGLG